jgi:hypothetical protein
VFEQLIAELEKQFESIVKEKGEQLKGIFERFWNKNFSRGDD